MMDVYQMDKNKTQALLARECELERPHLDISTHGEAASVGEPQVPRLVSSVFFQLT